MSAAAVEEVDRFRSVMRQVFSELVSESVSVRRAITLAEAKLRYPRSERVIQAIVEDPANQIRHSWIAGRGKGGREMSVNLRDLDRYFGVES